MQLLLLWHHQVMAVDHYGFHVNQPIPELLVFWIKVQKAADKEKKTIMRNRFERFKSYIRIRLSRKCTFSFAEIFFTLTGGMKMQHKYKPWPMSQQIMLGSVNKSRHISFVSKNGNYKYSVFTVFKVPTYSANFSMW